MLTHPISGVFRLRNPLILRLILFVVVLAKLAAGPEVGVDGFPGKTEAAGAPPAVIAATWAASCGTSMLGCWSLYV